MRGSNRLATVLGPDGIFPRLDVCVPQCKLRQTDTSSALFALLLLLSFLLGLFFGLVYVSPWLFAFLHRLLRIIARLWLLGFGSNLNFIHLFVEISKFRIEPSDQLQALLLEGGLLRQLLLNQKFETLICRLGNRHRVDHWLHHGLLE